MNIENLGMTWSEPKPVNTRNGPRTLQVAQPTPAFWGAWRSSKQELKNAGISCDKNRETGTWEICWWKSIGDDRNATYPTATADQQQAADVESKAAPVSVSRVWSPEQRAIFDWFKTGTGNAVVKARAGTGKTTTIKEAFSFAPESKMLYAVFNKKNQIEAQEKISDPRVEVKTLHSLGFLYIQSVWAGVKPDNSVEQDRILSVCSTISDDAAGCVERLINFSKNLLIAPTQETLEQLCEAKGIFCGDETPETGYPVKKLATIALQALELAKTRDERGRISFNDMVWLPVAMNWVSPRYDLVCVDECQDMNLPQLEMAVRACKKDGRICVVGDDRQAIYGFRGAAQDGVGMMQNRLQARVFGLTTTYRCPKAVVAIANEIVIDYHAHETAPDGLVENIELGMLTRSAKVGDAILSRLNAPLMSACLDLLRKGTPARIEGRDIGAQLVGMIRKLKAKSVPDFFRKLETWTDKQIKRFSGTKNAESKISQVEDQAATLNAVAQDCRSISEIESKIYSLFQDSDSNAKPAVVLSSVHKAKGLEWNKVFILTGTFKKNKGEEEANIYYVAVTRAKQNLTFVE